MTKIYRIPTGQVEGNGSNDNDTGEIRPYGEIAVYVGDNNKLELLMFDGVRTHVRSKVLNKGTFYGGDADSSDGLNYDTIKLVPDEVLRRNGSDQYLVIDPTVGEPGHIHIRAGGTIDNSGADLFLGGELNHVRVSDVGDYVRISTDANDAGATNSWNFGSNGALSLPSNLFIEPAANFAPVNGTFITQSSGEYLGIVSTGDGGTTQLGWAENALQPSRIASLGFNAGNAGTVDIITGDYTGTVYTWIFGTDGSLTFPSGGDITFDGSATSNIYGIASIEFADGTTQTTARESDTGSWTLTPGANNVSFTAPANSAYTMWVNGNIPNGIVVWNATVSLSNTNVPVVGSQYGWYYAQGNALVLDSIPDQIIGTAGSISSATVVTTTSNVFTFGITNNSTSSQVVNWGYVKL